MDDFFNISEYTSNKVLALVIYDIVDNKKRTKLAKYLTGYGFRIQKSAFEAVLSAKKYEAMVSGLKLFLGSEDRIRVYKIVGYSEVTVIGRNDKYSCEEVIII